MLIHTTRDAIVGGNIEVSALRFLGDGLGLGIGTSSGHCLLYDLRAKEPQRVKDLQYGLPVVDIKYHAPTNNIISADKKIVKIWNKDDVRFLP